MSLKIKEIFTVFILSIGIFLFVIDLFIINVSLPTIQKTLSLNNHQSQWIIILYIIGYTSVLINAGKAGAFFGYKKLYVMGILGFTFASLVCGLSTNFYILLIGRFLQGISSGFMVPQGLTLIIQLFEKEEKKAVALGIYGSIAGVASVLGQLLGGLLPDITLLNESWRLIFLINIPLGCVAVLIAQLKISKSEIVEKVKLSFLPMIQVFILLIGLIYPLIIGPELDLPFWCIGLLIVFVILIILFLKNEKEQSDKTQSALINFKLFKNKVFNFGLFAALAYYMVQDAYFIVNANYLQNFKHLSPTTTGIAFFYQGIGYVLASLIVGKYVQNHAKNVLLIGLSIMIIGLFFHLLLLNHDHLNLYYIHALFFFYGLGCGTVLPLLMTSALKDIPKNLIGVGSAIYLTVQQISICLGIAIVVGIYFQSNHLPFYVLQNLSTAYGLVIIVSIALLLVVAGLTCKN